MNFLIRVAVIVSASVFVTINAKFAYEKGYCEISTFNTLQDMLNREVSALINPTLRYSGNKGLRYDLYTPLNPNDRQNLFSGDKNSLRKSNFNPIWPVRFSIHGWTGKSTTCSNAAIKDAYLNSGAFNVIIVDWSDYSYDISYARISKQLPSIAASLAKFLRFLHRETGVPYANIYLVGHSAGTHVAGLAGKMLKPNMLGAIIALDPAGLTQRGLPENLRLAPNDAHYVESIHTDVNLLGNPSAKLSQASIFVNWGHGQPHCPNTTAAEFDFTCDHFAAMYYFAESVQNTKMFGAIQCENGRSIEKFNCGCTNGIDSCVADAFMGGEPPVRKRGVFYLSTSSRGPYGYGEMVRVKKAIASTSATRQKNVKLREFISRF